MIRSIEEAMWFIAGAIAVALVAAALIVRACKICRWEL